MDSKNQHYSKTRTRDLENLANLITSNFHKGLFHGFSDKDLKKIQLLINKLRTSVSASILFEPKHKERFLNRLDKLEAELYKDISTMDKFWGLFGEAGEMLLEFGKNAKPFVDRIEQIMKIVSTAETRDEEVA